MNDFEIPVPSNLEVILLRIFNEGTYVLYGLSILIVLIFSLILIFKTKANGRYLMLSGPLSYILFGIAWVVIYSPTRIPDYTESSLLPLSLNIFMPSFSVFLFVIGFARFVVWTKNIKT